MYGRICTEYTLSVSHYIDELEHRIAIEKNDLDQGALEESSVVK